MGSALLICGLLTITNKVAFPGYSAAIPVIGILLIIAAGQKAIVNRTLLSNPLAIWIGLISYPLYLWHWPLLAFAKITQGEENLNLIPHFRVYIFFTSLLLASLTFYFFEKRLLGKGILRPLLLFSLILILISGISYIVNINTYRIWLKEYNSERSVEEFGEDNKINHKECEKILGIKEHVRFCQISGTSKPTIAIIGDSHASAIYSGLKETLSDKSIANVSGRPFLNIATGIKSDVNEKKITSHPHCLQKL